MNDMVHADSSTIAQLLTNISLKWLKKVLLLPFYYSLVVYVVNCPPVDHGYDFHREVARISKWFHQENFIRGDSGRASSSG